MRGSRVDGRVGIALRDRAFVLIPSFPITRTCSMSARGPWTPFQGWRVPSDPDVPPFVWESIEGIDIHGPKDETEAQSEARTTNNSSLFRAAKENYVISVKKARAEREAAATASAMVVADDGSEVVEVDGPPTSARARYIARTQDRSTISRGTFS
jgi:hypothetical protein